MYDHIKREKDVSIRNEFTLADKKVSDSSSSSQTYSNDKYNSKLLNDVYTSKLIGFKNLPEPKNSTSFVISSDEEKYLW
ncbi:2566_t:CDS:2 [Cetraspora pellucida]|uniref:2566_t:CDS:1 n=1 Tax=Cetraspora pellucida TaxID=1433469 RepID=A0A9N9BT88_9GLOM|nr:2566_t:CDS:2 [Cetraspora pellucida]